MLRLASLFLVAALSAAMFGFTGMDVGVRIVEIAQILFLILLTLFLLFLMAGIAQQSRKS